MQAKTVVCVFVFVVDENDIQARMQKSFGDYLELLILVLFKILEIDAVDINCELRLCDLKHTKHANR